MMLNYEAFRIDSGATGNELTPGVHLQPQNRDPAVALLGVDAVHCLPVPYSAMTANHTTAGSIHGHSHGSTAAFEGVQIATRPLQRQFGWITLVKLVLIATPRERLRPQASRSLYPL